MNRIRPNADEESEPAFGPILVKRRCANYNMKKKATPLAAALDVGQTVLQVVSPPLACLIEVMIRSVSETEKAAQQNDMEGLRREAQRQELKMHVAERQAKVAQELALARRIESAIEVEMEEFYDFNASGHAGIKPDGTAITVGLSAQGQKVTKRIFRFKGTIPSA